MSLTIDLPEDQQAALTAKARAQGLSPEDYARQVLQRELVPPTVFEQGLGLFGSPEDVALLDEVVSIAYHERRRPSNPVSTL
jgi:plasmid stability protein